MHQPELVIQEMGPDTGVDLQFSAMMKEARSKMGLSQRQLAEALEKAGLKIDPSAVTRIENGQREPKLREAVAISDLLDFQLDALVFSESAEFRRNLFLINNSLVAARKLILAGLEAVDSALSNATPATESEMAEFGGTASLLEQQVQIFHDWVDRDLLEKGRNFSRLRGGPGDHVKEMMVEALVHKILRREPDVDADGRTEA